MQSIRKLLEVINIVVIYGRASSLGQTQTQLGREFIPLLPQAAALRGLGAGSDGVELASGFVIKNRQTSYFVWCPM